jgi:hypothetical protein
VKVTHPLFQTESKVNKKLLTAFDKYANYLRQIRQIYEGNFFRKWTIKWRTDFLSIDRRGDKRYADAFFNPFDHSFNDMYQIM